MAARPKLLDRQESAELAGVSPETIKRYINYGLIEPVEEDGEEFVSEHDILNLFQVEPKTIAAKADEAKKPENVLQNIVLGKNPPTSISRSTTNSKANEDLLEISKSLKERINNLVEERNWLRERLEKTEKRLETQENLLIAETQTVRQLITHQLEASNNKRLGFLNPKRLLPWFGN